MSEVAFANTCIVIGQYVFKDRPIGDDLYLNRFIHRCIIYVFRNRVMVFLQVCHRFLPAPNDVHDGVIASTVLADIRSERIALAWSLLVYNSIRYSARVLITLFLVIEPNVKLLYECHFVWSRDKQRPERGGRK
jgi:hypothetical protein